MSRRSEHIWPDGPPPQDEIEGFEYVSEADNHRLTTAEQAAREVLMGTRSHASFDRLLRGFESRALRWRCLDLLNAPEEIDTSR